MKPVHRLAVLLISIWVILGECCLLYLVYQIVIEPVAIFSANAVHNEVIRFSFSFLVIVLSLGLCVISFKIMKDELEDMKHHQE